MKKEDTQRGEHTRVGRKTFYLDKQEKSCEETPEKDQRKSCGASRRVK